MVSVSADGEPLNFSLAEFESIWGLMTVQPLDKYYAVGGIMAKNDATEAALAETLRKVAANRSAAAAAAASSASSSSQKLQMPRKNRLFQNRMQRQMFVLVIAVVLIYVFNLQSEVKKWIFGM